MKYRIFPITFAVIFLACTFAVVIQQPGRLSRLTARFFPTPTPKAIEIKGIGVLGDSLSDEYRADDDRGFQYAPTTLNWIEQLVKSRNLDFGPWNTWGDVRRTGFAYNWSRSGASTESVLVNDQPEGLAEYIREGEVNVVIVYLGANDFGPHNFKDGYLPIFSESLNDAALQQKIDRTVSNIITAVETLQQAGEVHVMLVTVPDWNLNVALQYAPIDEEGKARFSGAIKQVNTRLREFAQKRDVNIVDINALYQTQLASAPLGSIIVGDEVVSLLVPGDDPHQAFLSDGAHPGTILNGMFANYLIENMNKELGTSIPPLRTDEILGNAGL